MDDKPMGIAANELDDADLERELRHMYETRADTFFKGSSQALQMHTDRMLELEAEYATRFPDRVEPHERRTREGARAASGQDPNG